MLLSNQSHLFIERCLWPRVLTQHERETVMGSLVQRQHDPGGMVCHRDEIADSWIGVVDGFLRVQDTTVDGRLVMFTGIANGGWIGEGSLLKLERRKYEIVATRPTVTLHLPRDKFQWLVDRSIPFNHFMLSYLNERLSQFIAMVKFDRLLEPTPRVARGISSLFHPVLYPNTEPTLRVSQEELAWMVGVSRQRVNAAVRELEKEGLIKAGYGLIHVLDLQGLSKFG